MKFSWRGDRTFPASFIVFFVFGAIFVGEHLPTIIGFLVNHYNYPDSKPSFFDLGGPGDIGVVFVIYAVFGTLLWLFYRVFSWPIILVIGATLGGLAEVFLFKNEAYPAEDVVNLRFIISSVVVWGSLITVLPQTVYQSISRRWAGQGQRLAIITVIVLNLLSLFFLAYQKYGLGKVNYSKSGFPVGTCPDRLVDQKGQPALAYLKGQKFTRVGKEAYDWIQVNCPGAIERIE